MEMRLFESKAMSASETVQMGRMYSNRFSGFRHIPVGAKFSPQFCSCRGNCFQTTKTRRQKNRIFLIFNSQVFHFFSVFSRKLSFKVLPFFDEFAAKFSIQELNETAVCKRRTYASI